MSKLRYFAKSEEVDEFLTKEEFYSIKRVCKGKGSEVDQKVAIDCIARKIAGLNDQSFCPENDRISAFNEGARFVGRFIFKIDQSPADYFEQRAKQKAAALMKKHNIKPIPTN